MATLKADRRLYVTADRSEIVEHGDPRGAWLLAAEGRNIGEADVAKFGLSMRDGRVHYDGAPQFESAKQATKPNDKQAAAPQNKSAAASEPEEAAEDAGDDGGGADDEAVESEEPSLEGLEAEWEGRGLKSDPENYLARSPDGPNAELAEQIVAARSSADEG